MTRFGIALLVVGLGWAVPAGWAVAGGGAVVLAWQLVAASRGGSLFGPLARWEMVRTARRGMFPFVRCIVLFLMLLYLPGQFSRYGGVSYFGAFVSGNRPLQPGQAARIGEAVAAAFAVLFAILALIGVVLRIPPMIAEERESRRFEHLLATDLSDREILVGKLVGRAGAFLLNAITVVPVMVLLSFLGGVEPSQVALFVLAAGLTFLGAVGCCFANVHGPKAAGNSFVTFFMAFVVLTASGVVDYVLGRLPPLTPAYDPLLEVARFISRGNPFVAFRAGWQTPPDALSQYAGMQLLVCAAGYELAARGLRREARTPGRAAVVPSPRARPPVTDEPVRWYVATASTPEKRSIARIERFLRASWKYAASAVVTFVVAYGWTADPANLRGAQNMFAGSGIVAFFAVTVPTLWVACRALPRERQQDTLLCLRLTDLTPVDILNQQRLGALDVTRPALWAVCIACGACVLAGIAHPASAAALTATTIGNRYLAAALGIRLGVTAKTPAAAVGRGIGFGFLWYFGLALLVGCAGCGGYPIRDFVIPLFVALFPPGLQAASTSLNPKLFLAFDNATLLMVASTAVVYFFFCKFAILWARSSAETRLTAELSPAREAP